MIRLSKITQELQLIDTATLLAYIFLYVYPDK